MTRLKSGENTKALEQISILQKKFPKTLLYARIQILLAKILEKDGQEEKALNVLSKAEKR